MSAVLDTDVGHMRLSAGYRSATTAAGRFAAPRQLGRGRRSGVLYAMAAVENDPDEAIARLVLQAVGQTFQGTSGSLTARLRRAVQAGSTALFQENLDLTSGSLRGGGVACAVLRDDSLYLTQAGRAVACLCQRGSLICYPEGDLDDKAGEKAFGRRHDPYVRLACHPVKPGDTAVLADASLIGQVGDETLIEVLSAADASLSLDSLAAALSAGEGAVLVLAMRGGDTATPVPSAAPVVGVSRERRRAPPEPMPRPAELSEEEAEPFQVPAPAGPTLAERLASVRQVAGSWLADARPVVGDWLRRLMPDASLDRSERRAAARQPRRRMASVDNRMWQTVALVLPLIVLLVVAGTYWKRGWDRQARYTELMDEVDRQLDVAATGEEATVRQALETALTTLEEAAQSAPQNKEVSNLQADVQQQLDALNKVFRLQQVEHLHTYPPTGEVDEIVVHGTGVYVLDRLTDRVYHHRLNESRTALELEEEKLLVRKGDQPDTAAAMGDLVGMTWVSDGIGRLLILGRNGLLLTYDPAWERLTGTMLPDNETWQYPVAVSSYRGRFYVLDPGLGQVLRYLASSGGDVSPPEEYFVEEGVDTAGAIDMAIDGFIYLLFDDGHLERYFAGKRVPMTLSLPDRPLHQPLAIYAAPDEEALFLYVADPSNHRVIRCDKEGRLVQQFLLEGNDVLGQVRDIFVDELHDRLYLLSDNQLFLMDIPPP